MITNMQLPYGASPTNESEQFLDWIRLKHREDSPEYLQRLVVSCAEEFARDKNLTQERRALIYGRIRRELRLLNDARLRKHAQLPCCS